MLSFILQLGFCSLGTDYVCDNDDTEMSQVIQHFRELGLVFKRKRSSKENVIHFLTRIETSNLRCFLVASDGIFSDKIFLISKSVFIQQDFHYQYRYVEVQKSQELTKKSLSLSKQITEYTLTQERF